MKGSSTPALLVVAKAPVPGEAKTRLQSGMSPALAAEVAAACLLDTLDVVADAPASGRVVAMTGDLERAARRDELVASLSRFVVVAQRGATFADRLAAAHRDALAGVRAGVPAVIQIGMDTPQVRVEDLTDAAGVLDDRDAVLGPAVDGGWWLLGLRESAVEVGAAALTGVPMSRADTHDRTRAALERAGLSVGVARSLCDVDEPEDFEEVLAVGTVGGRLARVIGAGATTPTTGRIDLHATTGMSR